MPQDVSKEKIFFIFLWDFVYTGLGARSVASLGGRGARLWRHPGSVY